MRRRAGAARKTDSWDYDCIDKGACTNDYGGGIARNRGYRFRVFMTCCLCTQGFDFLLVEACAVLVTTLQTFAYPNASVEQQPETASKISDSRQPTVAIFRFAVQSEITDTTVPSSQVCSQYTGGANSGATLTKPDKLTVDPKVLAAILVELKGASLRRTGLSWWIPIPTRSRSGVSSFADASSTRGRAVRQEEWLD